MAQHPLRQTAHACLLHARLFTLQAHRAATVIACSASAAADVYCGAHAIVVCVSIAMACALTLLFREYLPHETIVALRKRSAGGFDHAWNPAHTPTESLAESLTVVGGHRTAVVMRSRTVQP